MSETTRYPLCWPDGWRRTQSRTSAFFGKKETVFDAQMGRDRYAGKKRLSIADAIKRVAEELARMSISEDTVVISTNLKLNLHGIPRGDSAEPRDPGAAVYWERKGKKQCMAIGRLHPRSGQHCRDRCHPWSDARNRAARGRANS